MRLVHTDLYCPTIAPTEWACNRGFLVDSSLCSCVETSRWDEFKSARIRPGQYAAVSDEMPDPSVSAAWAAASRAMGTRKGEQET